MFAKGAPLCNCWGVIDRTARPISRPTKNQRIKFSGHKRVHCITFQVRLYSISVSLWRVSCVLVLCLQSVVPPNGLVAHMFGPIEGNRDVFMLYSS